LAYGGGCKKREMGWVFRLVFKSSVNCFFCGFVASIFWFDMILQLNEASNCIVLVSCHFTQEEMIVMMLYYLNNFALDFGILRVGVIFKQKVLHPISLKQKDSKQNKINVKYFEKWSYSYRYHHFEAHFA